MTGELVVIVRVREDAKRARYRDLVTLRATGDGNTNADCEASAWRTIHKRFRETFPDCTMHVESKRWKVMT